MIKIETKGVKLPVAFIGQSSTLQTGESVLTIGSPCDCEYTVSQGVVSNLARGYIQTDAKTAPGNLVELSLYFIIIFSLYLFLL